MIRRFAFVIHYAVYGGPHNQALQLDGPLKEAGWIQTVILPDEPGSAAPRLEEAGVDTVKMPLTRMRASADPRLHLSAARNFTSDVRRLKAFFENNNIELVVIGGLVNPHAAIAARAAGVPVVWQVLDTRAPRAVCALFTPLLALLATVVMTTGRRIVNHHPGLRHLSQRTVPFFPPVDTCLFSRSEETRSAVRDELELGDGLTVGTIGNLAPMKDHLMFVNAAAMLRRELPDVRFVILGSDYAHRTGYTQMLKTRAESLGLTIGTDIQFIEPRGEVYRLAQAFDLFWLTSKPGSEGVPTAIGEAMSLAIPVVATSVAGVPDALTDDCGVLVPPQNPGILAERSATLLADPVTLGRMAGHSRQRAQAVFAIPHCVASHVSAFELALKRSHKLGSPALVKEETLG